MTFFSDRDPYIIAEVGQNHQGSVDTAFDYISALHLKEQMLSNFRFATINIFSAMKHIISRMKVKMLLLQHMAHIENI